MESFPWKTPFPLSPKHRIQIRLILRPPQIQVCQLFPLLGLNLPSLPQNLTSGSGDVSSMRLFKGTPS